MDAKTEPNDNLLDLPAAVTTSQRILVKALMKFMDHQQAETNERLQDISQVVKEIRRLEEEGRERGKQRETAIKRGVMQILKGIGWID